MPQSRTVQCCIDEYSSVVIRGARCGGEGHIASPTLWSFRMNTAQDHPSLSERSFDNRRCSIGIRSHDQPPTCELWTVFPVMFDYWRVDTGYWYRSLVDTSIHYPIKVKLHARRQVQAVAIGFSSQKPSGANPKIVDARCARLFEFAGLSRVSSCYQS